MNKEKLMQTMKTVGGWVFVAFCLLLADIIGRTIAAPYEISAAVIMSVVGGPAFILLLRKARGTYGE